jgi:hypothetical protein
MEIMPMWIMPIENVPIGNVLMQDTDVGGSHGRASGMLWTRRWPVDHAPVDAPPAVAARLCRPMLTSRARWKKIFAFKVT